MTTTPLQRHPGEPCSHRRYDCRGHLVVEVCVPARSGKGWRPARGEVAPDVATKAILVCNRCGQAHGPAPVTP